ncbi:hypothetical protein KSS87_013611, partial [Heliosperma pusillum]
LRNNSYNGDEKVKAIINKVNELDWAFKGSGGVSEKGTSANGKINSDLQTQNTWNRSKDWRRIDKNKGGSTKVRGRARNRLIVEQKRHGNIVNGAALPLIKLAGLSLRQCSPVFTPSRRSDYGQDDADQEEDPQKDG